MQRSGCVATAGTTGYPPQQVNGSRRLCEQLMDMGRALSKGVEDLAVKLCVSCLLHGASAFLRCGVRLPVPAALALVPEQHEPSSRVVGYTKIAARYRLRQPPQVEAPAVVYAVYLLSVSPETYCQGTMVPTFLYLYRKR